MIVGTAGHIDHGKTSLVKALTGVDADRLPEEKARGITLDLGYAYTPLADGSVLGFVDVPGHEKLIHNMLAGTTGIDFVLLVIAADDGPMPQTREHLELLDLLGLSLGAVALSKIDRVSSERLSEVRAEIDALLAGTCLKASPLFPLSSRSGAGVPALRAHLEAIAQQHPARSGDGRFRLAIDRCFTLTGVGTVVTGTAHSGKVRAGETLIISPPGLPARVRSLHVQDRVAEQGQAGERCALALAGDFEKQDLARGMWLVDPALAIPFCRFHCEVRVPASQALLKHRQAVHVHLGASDILGRVVLLEGDELQPGATALAEIILEQQTLAVRGDRFILRDAGAQRTVAGGRVLDIFPPQRYKRAAERLSLLRAMGADDPTQTLTMLAAHAPAGIDLSRFAANWNLNPSAAEALWAAAGLRIIREGELLRGFSYASWLLLEQRLLAALAREHQSAPDMTGVERERLRRMTLATLPPSAFAVLVTELLAAQRIAQTRAWLHLPEHRAQVSAADRELFSRLKPLLDASPYNPPRVRDIFKSSGILEDSVRQLFRRLSRAGELYPVALDHYFTAGAVAHLAAMLQTLCLEQGAVRAAALRDRIGGGRKVAIHILEFFDRIGYTRRVRDEHIVRREGSAQEWIAP